MELGILGHINHPNTASLVGCCVENGLYLIFNYYPMGTLYSALHGILLLNFDALINFVFQIICEFIKTFVNFRQN